MKNYANYWFPLGQCSKWLGPEAVCWGMTWCSLWGLRGVMYLRHRTIRGLAPELSQLGKRVAQWYAPFHQSPFLFLIKSIPLSLSQSKLSCSHVLLICEIDEYQNSHDINPNPISPMLAQNRRFPSNHTPLWSTSLQPFAIVALWRSKYQLTKYPNCIFWKLWCVPVTSVTGFFSLSSLTSQKSPPYVHIIKAGSQTVFCWDTTALMRISQIYKWSSV